MAPMMWTFIYSASSALLMIVILKMFFTMSTTTIKYTSETISVKNNIMDQSWPW